MLKSNFHTHTYRCGHSTGTEREYVETAIEMGLKSLGFSDHTPYMFDNGYVSGIRMKPEQAEDYAKTVLDLKKEYAKDINVYLGFEVEYYPKHFDATVKFLNQFDPDYFLYAQHFLKNEYDGVYAGAKTEGVNVLKEYVNQMIEAMETEQFAYLAHPDLINFTGDKNVYAEQMSRICKKAKEHNLPLEFNLLGFSDGRNYPKYEFFKLAEKYKNNVIFGIDAHHVPALLECQKITRSATEFLKDLNLNIVDKINLKNKR